MINLENSPMLIFWQQILFYWCCDGVIVLGQNVVNSNWKSDLVEMATAVNSRFPSQILLNQKALDLGNTQMYGFLHLAMYYFFISRLSILIFDVRQSKSQILMTHVTTVRGDHRQYSYIRSSDHAKMYHIPHDKNLISGPLCRNQQCRVVFSISVIIWHIVYEYLAARFLTSDDALAFLLVFELGHFCTSTWSVSRPVRITLWDT